MTSNVLSTEPVFTPAIMPTDTYVEHGEPEQKLGRAMRTAGMLISISAPTKTGKTVLVPALLAALTEEAPTS